MLDEPVYKPSTFEGFFFAICFNAASKPTSLSLAPASMERRRCFSGVSLTLARVLLEAGRGRPYV